MIIRSISGVRGITKSSLTPETIKLYAHAFHDLIPDGLKNRDVEQGRMCGRPPLSFIPSKAKESITWESSTVKVKSANS